MPTLHFVFQCAPRDIGGKNRVDDGVVVHATDERSLQAREVLPPLFPVSSDAQKDGVANSRTRNICSHPTRLMPCVPARRQIKSASYDAQ
jgi:hypothetical protein